METNKNNTVVKFFHELTHCDIGKNYISACKIKHYPDLLPYTATIQYLGNDVFRYLKDSRVLFFPQHFTNLPDEAIFIELISQNDDTALLIYSYL